MSGLNSGRSPRANTIEPIDKHIGLRVKLARLQVGLSQERMAFLLGVQRNKIYKWERGLERLTNSRIWRIAQLTKVEPAFFYEGFEEPRADGDPVGDPINLAHLLEPYNITQMARLHKLSTADRKVMDEVLEAIEIRAAAREAMAEQASG